MKPAQSRRTSKPGQEMGRPPAAQRRYEGAPPVNYQARPSSIFVSSSLRRMDSAADASKNRVGYQKANHVRPRGDTHGSGRRPAQATGWRRRSPRTTGCFCSPPRLLPRQSRVLDITKSSRSATSCFTSQLTSPPRSSGAAARWQFETASALRSSSPHPTRSAMDAHCPPARWHFAILNARPPTLSTCGLTRRFRPTELTP